ncbi:hypothetical protein GQ43DRAFT_478894 [Delitschia confertaspora ATCC 74209]|uniref:IEC3 subunit of the Ino80 complex, chromatin re-modelling-domain-containing protein n=1 Tax=Delitschia confertaspora ATCC 74209 TaxID=1513339 RepID=A0A9P4MS08_9PLEO|nr:hypothetical protein GQ43DRAFT_478894 [Delitschia confertaspora ATCC 74209]
MSGDASAHFEGILHVPPNQEIADNEQKPPVKRSWRRKYRKMRAQFEDTMNMSNQLIKDEYKAIALARRLQEQNDQILDLLLDINETSRIPSFLRYDLRSPSPSRSALPPLETPDPEAIQRRIQELRADMVAQVITPEEFAHKMDQLNSSQSVLTKPSSLADMAATIPHSTKVPDPLPEGLMLGENCPGYYSPDHEEEYLLALDSLLDSPTQYDANAHDGKPLRIPNTQSVPTEKDLTLRNPDSVYNWLRKHQPQVFLQDKDPHHHENLSEKSSAKPANAPSGQRGKRGSAVLVNTPGPKAEQDLLDEEIGFIPESGKGGSRAKRERDDDGAYRPKGGSSRGGKRKREGAGGEEGGKRKKGRASGGGD